MQNIKICPYPGLRPFNENESIFFKGRDEHVEKIIRQLEQNKFIMLTGASGDGKSSLVFAGIIPNARAGFFKAKFNNWILADFRPERDPLKNLAGTISRKLNIHDEVKTEKELSYGFSSLINLYKSSPYYLDTGTDEYKFADESTRKKLKLKAANLIILVDQFEEFFTNIENFSNEKPSLRAQTVVNLLLETARLALAQDIPIYIICTMRSDYIGQCAAFHGLPEYIGFSQFFVPRLKRKEIQQVIEEPAKLSGCKISNRLTQILINELGEGFDQLPVLQHALNQIWHDADKGNEVMDMIHLAKLGGMPPQLLSEESKSKFEDWFVNLSSTQQELIRNPSLENLLNSHANELFYREARIFYNQSHKEEISIDDVSNIVKTTFQCLTRIDHSRAVRNRMTLQEITDIINKPEITTDVVASVLDVFRVEGNTFLKPFITNAAETKKMNPDTVLDITHESLIRNWKMLHEWANEEHKHYLTFLDFKKQLQRWVDSKKSTGYLLPIGPLTFFENWFNKFRPNVYWIKKYDDSDETDEIKLRGADADLKNAEEFIRKSARNLFVSRTILKYGANKIATLAGIVVLTLICIYYYFDYRGKQNDKVLDDIEWRCKQMLSSKSINNKTKADFMISYSRLNSEPFEKVLDGFNNDTISFDIAWQMFLKLQGNNQEYGYRQFERGKRDTLNSFENQIYLYLKRAIHSEIFNREIKKANDNFFKRYLDFMKLCYYLYSNKIKGDYIDEFTEGIRLIPNYLKIKCDSLNRKENDIRCLYTSADILISFDTLFKFQETDSIISMLSPFHSSKNIKIFDHLFSSTQSIKYYGSPVNHHLIGFSILAYLYSSNGNIENAISSLDSIKKYSPISNNSASGRFFTSVVKKCIYYYSRTHSIPDPNFTRLIDESRYSLTEKYLTIYHNLYLGTLSNKLSLYEIRNDDFFNNKSYINTCLYSKSDEFFNLYLSEIKTSVTDASAPLIKSNPTSIIPAKTPDLSILNPKISSPDINSKPTTKVPDSKMIDFMKLLDKYVGPLKNNLVSGVKTNETNERNFKLALAYKEKGLHYYEEPFYDTIAAISSFNTAMEYYQKLDSNFLEQSMEIGSRLFGVKKVKHSELFIWPNSIDIYNEISINFYISGKEQYFLDYLIKKGINKYYFSSSSIKLYELFLYRLIGNNFMNNFVMLKKNPKLNYTYFNVGRRLNETYSKGEISSLFLDLVEIEHLFSSDKSKAALLLYENIKLDKEIIISLINQDQEKTQINKFLLFSLAKNLAINNFENKSLEIINSFDDKADRNNSLIEIAYILQTEGRCENSFVYLNALYKDVDDAPIFGLKLLRVNALIGSEAMYRLTTHLVKEVKDESKPRALINLIRGICYNRFYYKALKSIPDYVSPTNEMQLYTEIIKAEISNKIKELRKSDRNYYNPFDEYDKANYGDTYADWQKFGGSNLVEFSDNE